MSDRKHEMISQKSQTLILFALLTGVLFGFVAFAVDLGMYYLNDARLSRAADSAVLAGVQNAGKGATNVSALMYNMAVANHERLRNLNPTPTVSTITLTNYLGQSYSGIQFRYDPTGGSTYVSKMTNIVELGANGAVNAAQQKVNTETPTYFMPVQGFGNFFTVRANAKAQRRPRMIAIVLDRSGSLISNGGSTNLPGAVNNFLSQFDTSVDYISISSFSDIARLDMQMIGTTNLTNVVYTGTVTNSQVNYAIMGTNAMITNNVNPGGIRFGGYTVASEGLRMGMETLQKGSVEGWNDPNTVKYIVFFTDGQFNGFRTLTYSPGLTNVVYGQTGPNYLSSGGVSNHMIFPYHSTSNDFASRGNASFVASNIFLTNATAGRTVVVTTNWPGSIRYVMEWMQRSGSNLVTASSLSGITNVFTNSFTNTFESIFTNSSDYIPVVKSVVISQITNSLVSTQSLAANEFVMYVEPGYTNLDVVLTPTKLDQTVPQFFWINHQTNDYPPIDFWRRSYNSGGRFTNLGIYDPLTNGTPYTNGFLYFTNASTVWTNYNNVRAESLQGAPFTNGMNSFILNGITYTNSTRYWTGTNWIRTAGIYTNTGMTTNNYGLVFTNVIMVSQLDPASGLEVNPQIASFVYSTNIAAVPQLRVMPMSFSSRPKSAYIASSNSWVDLWISHSNRKYFTNTSGITNQWENFVENEADRAAMRVCNYARMSNVTVFTVGLGSGVNTALLRQLANDPASTNYNGTQPQGGYYFATNAASINTQFKAIAEKIRAVITQ